MLTMILASLTFRAALACTTVGTCSSGGITYPCTVTSAVHPVRIEVARFRQAPSWLCCLRQWSPPEQWARYWPKARREALEPFGVWVRSRIAAGERVTFELPTGTYLTRSCWNRDTVCSAWGEWRTVAP